MRTVSMAPSGKFDASIAQLIITNRSRYELESVVKILTDVGLANQAFTSF